MTKKAKILLGVFIPIGVIVIVLTVLLSVLFQSTRIKAGVGNTDGAYKSVLGGIENITEANPRIVDIAMIGAHGASSNAISPSNPTNPKDAPTMIGKMKPLIKGFTFRFAKTQTVNTYQLLLQGARFFQIKCCFYDGKWMAEHSLLSDPLEVYIKDILKFLGETKGEIVIAQLEPTYVGEKTVAELEDYALSVEFEGKTLKDYVNYGAVNLKNEDGVSGVRVGDLRYNDVTKSGEQSGVVLAGDWTVDGVPLNMGTSEGAKYFFDVDYYSSNVWHNRFSSKVLIKKIDENAKNIRDHFDDFKDILRINQTQGSFNANVSDFGNMITTSSLIDFANKHNPVVLDDPRFEEWLAVMPITHFDYVTCNNKNFNARLNEKIIAYNVKLVGKLIEA